MWAVCLVWKCCGLCPKELTAWRGESLRQVCCDEKACARMCSGCQNQHGEQKKNQNSVHPNEHLLIVQVLGKTLHVGFYLTLILSYQVSYPLDST